MSCVYFLLLAAVLDLTLCYSLNDKPKQKSREIPITYPDDARISDLNIHHHHRHPGVYTSDFIHDPEFHRKEEHSERRSDDFECSDCDNEVNIVLTYRHRVHLVRTSCCDDGNLLMMDDLTHWVIPNSFFICRIIISTYVFHLTPLIALHYS